MSKINVKSKMFAVRLCLTPIIEFHLEQVPNIDLGHIVNNVFIVQQIGFDFRVFNWLSGRNDHITMLFSFFWIRISLTYKFEND